MNIVLQQSLLCILFLFIKGSLAAFTIKEAECIALSQNKDICTFEQLFEKAKQGRLESISKLLPEIHLISRGYQTENVQVETKTRSAFQSQFSLTQSIFSLDRYYHFKISTLVVDHLNLLLDAVKIDVLFGVRRAYYQVILDYQNVATAKKNVEILSFLAKRMQRNYEIGTSILLNVNQSKVAVANAAAGYYQAVKQLKIDQDILVKLLGYNPGDVEVEFPDKEIPIDSICEIASKVIRVKGVFSDDEIDGSLYRAGFPETEEKLMHDIFSADEIAWWEEAAFAYRPELRTKSNEVSIANQEISKERGAYFPSVSFEANCGGNPTNMNSIPSSKFTNQRMDWAVGFSLNWLLFDSMGREHRINQARFERNAKKCEYMKEVQTTYEEVRRQIFTITESVSSLVTAEGNVKLAEQTLELANKQLEIGYITVFDYQIVVNSLIEAMYIRNQAQYDLIEGYYGLRHASGIDLARCKE